ncbi:MAG TPA: hypothetical protein VK929_02830 [Longimicrobiales bacterium]|nr:hypothetical protein [Longimicrobiales bacterium]
MQRSLLLPLAAIALGGCADPAAPPEPSVSTAEAPGVLSGPRTAVPGFLSTSALDDVLDRVLPSLGPGAGDLGHVLLELRVLGPTGPGRAAVLARAHSAMARLESEHPEHAADLAAVRLALSVH